MTREVLSGNHAQAHAVRLARAQVISAYPITPQTTIVEKLAELVAAGELDARFVEVESEHSALQVVVSAAALGARTYTATSSQGLLLMHELLHWASGLRAPIVMGVVNRAVAPPWNIGADHTDTVAQRDTGWVQFYPESNQEVLDTVLQAYRLAELEEVRLPALVAEDAFYLSHTVEPVEVPSAETADRFLPPRGPVGTLPLGGPARLGSFTGPDRYVEFRHELARATAAVLRREPEVEQEYARLTHRAYGGALPTYRAEGADAVLVTMGTMATTARTVVDELREAGQKVGLARLRRFRPFPEAELRALASSVERIGVVDRSYTFGAAGAAATESRAALYASPRHPAITSFLAGVGGRDVTPAHVRRMFTELLGPAEPEARWEDLLPVEASTDG